MALLDKGSGCKKFQSWNLYETINQKKEFISTAIKRKEVFN